MSGLIWKLCDCFYHYYFLGDEGWGSDFDSEDDEDHEVWLSSLI